MVSYALLHYNYCYGYFTSTSADSARRRQGGSCGHWLRLVRFLIVRANDKGEMRMDAHFRLYGAWMHLRADP